MPIPHLRELISAGRAQEGPPPKLCPKHAMQFMSNRPFTVTVKSEAASSKHRPGGGEPSASDCRSCNAVFISMTLCLQSAQESSHDPHKPFLLSLCLNLTCYPLCPLKNSQRDPSGLSLYKNQVGGKQAASYSSCCFISSPEAPLK